MADKNTAVSATPSAPVSDSPIFQAATPTQPAPRDRRNEKPADHGVIIEGIINPSPKAVDPKNPAGAPILKATFANSTQQSAHDELQELLRKDVSSLSPAEKADHDKKVHALHYKVAE